MDKAILVFVGGGLGALARYWLSGAVHRLAGATFPYGTLVVNVTGCFLIGMLMAAFEDRFLVAPSLRLFLVIGILGGFTTFSSFSFETISLLRDGEVLMALWNVAGSILLCLGATYAGVLTGKLF